MRHINSITKEQAFKGYKAEEKKMMYKVSMEVYTGFGSYFKTIMVGYDHYMKFEDVAKDIFNRFNRDSDNTLRVYNEIARMTVSYKQYFSKFNREQLTA